jgi:hypothetical protein
MSLTQSGTAGYVHEAGDSGDLKSDPCRERFQAATLKPEQKDFQRNVPDLYTPTLPLNGLS